jgi:hypothetical protein
MSDVERCAEPIEGSPERLPARRARRLVASLLILGVALGVGCSGVSVVTDFDPDVEFTGFKKYAWLPDERPGGDPRLHNDLIDAVVRRSVDGSLAERGFEKVPLASADFLVTYYLGLETRIDVRTVHSSFRYSRRGWSGSVGTDTRVRQYERGTLLIDVLDPSSRRLVWRGSADSRVSSRSDPARRDQQIDDAVRRILDRFPPQ